MELDERMEDVGVGEEILVGQVSFEELISELRL